MAYNDVRVKFLDLHVIHVNSTHRLKQGGNFPSGPRVLALARNDVSKWSSLLQVCMPACANAFDRTFNCGWSPLHK